MARSIIIAADLRKMYRRIRPDADDDQHALFRLSKKMLQFYLGTEWCQKCLHSSNPYFGIIEATGRGVLSYRTIYFAEVLYNLQGHVGFRYLLKKLQTENLTSTFAEMEAAMFFREHQIDVQFIEGATNTGKGSNYDLQVIMNGKPVAVEVKSKVASTEVSSQTLYKKLDKAASQLPKGRPGIIFVRLPKEWIGDFLRQAPFEAAVNKFFDGRNTRVIAIFGVTEMIGIPTPNNGHEPLVARIYKNPVQVHGDLLSSFVNKPDRMRRDNYRSVQVVVGLAPAFTELGDEWELKRYLAAHPEEVLDD